VHTPTEYPPSRVNCSEEEKIGFSNVGSNDNTTAGEQQSIGASMLDERGYVWKSTKPSISECSTPFPFPSCGPAVDLMAFFFWHALFHVERISGSTKQTSPNCLPFHDDTLFRDAHGSTSSTTDLAFYRDKISWNNYSTP